VERHQGGVPAAVKGAALHDRRFLDASLLTQPDDALREAAREIQRVEPGGFGLALAVTSWVNRVMAYAPGSTGVKTTAAEALALGQGVCQDYAHVMIAICRLCGLPARYVSGHLLGEGAMHAWVEVLLPVPDRPGEGLAWAFDPTHDRLATQGYLTVAVGRDFADVSPTRGSFRSSGSGSLASRQSARLTAVEYF
jgi:transglutaminase-like putative cysteine protease